MKIYDPRPEYRKVPKRVKLMAYAKLFYSIKTGKIIKPKKCSLCGGIKHVHASFKDYNLFKFIWACVYCSTGIHKSEYQKERDMRNNIKSLNKGEL